MSENPASEAQIGNLGMQQGLQLQDLATQQAQQQAALSESGRTTWLNSIMQLAGLKPGFSQPTSTTNSTLTNPSTAPGSLGTIFGNTFNPALTTAQKDAGQGANGFIQTLMQMFGMGGPIGAAA
jgi:hypothetical protein